ncbi:unnamed protein product [Owenia fusiformis]|uniref:pectate lyase n=1 Tax=Owenia fusiformis TaxID=6347 RepID=A0A8J1YBL2_OWEFU|nr:unnamed protein product [Owenia fusiformis]
MLLLGILVLSYFGAVIGQAPKWFNECVGYGCGATKYRHKRCEAKPDYKDLLKCVNQADFVHVTFKGSGKIKLPASIKPRRGLILDGSGRDITITGESIQLVSDSIVYRINFDTGKDDGLKLRGKYKNAWIHRCSFRNYDDGLVDITKGFSHVTVSNSKFADHDKTMLIGASEKDVGDVKMRITLHSNYFINCRQRLPRVRYASVHVFNNFFQDWGLYAVGSSQKAYVLLENNYFKISDKKRAKTAHETEPRGEDKYSGYLRAEGNYYTTGIKGKTNKSSRVSYVPYKYKMMKADKKMSVAIKAGAGYKSK